MDCSSSLLGLVLKENEGSSFCDELIFNWEEDEMEDDDVIPTENKLYSTREYWEERYKK